MLEKDLEKYFVKKAEIHGAWAVKFWPKFCKGFPDRLLFAPRGRIFLVELKTYTGRPSKIQKYIFTKLFNLGFVVHLLFGKKDIDEFFDHEVGTT